MSYKAIRIAGFNISKEAQPDSVQSDSPFILLTMVPVAIHFGISTSNLLMLGSEMVSR